MFYIPEMSFLRPESQSLKYNHGVRKSPYHPVSGGRWKPNFKKGQLVNTDGLLQLMGLPGVSFSTISLAHPSLWKSSFLSHWSYLQGLSLVATVHLLYEIQSSLLVQPVQCSLFFYITSIFMIKMKTQGGHVCLWVHKRIFAS